MVISNNEIDTCGPTVWCKDGEMWLNVPVQFEEHKIGKKRKNNPRKNKDEDEEIGELLRSSRSRSPRR